MDGPCVPLARVALGGALMVAMGSIAACASSGSDGAGAPVALFRTPVGHASEAVAPGLKSAWYVQRGPVLYTRTGMAAWRATRTPAWGAWIDRLLPHGETRTAVPVAVAALSSDLPAPALVQVTSLQTYKTITVRVDDKAHLHGAIIQLPIEAAGALGADPAHPLSIRLRYLAPVYSYREPPTLRYALLGPGKRVRGEPAPVLLAQARTAPTTPPVAAPAATPPGTPAIVRVSQIAPPEPAPRPVLAEPVAPRLRGRLEVPRHAFRIQAGAFAQRANAERAVGLLAPAGRAEIVPIRRGDLTLYRVVLAAPTEAAAAERLRARVAGIGFSDAELIRPL